MVTATFRCLFLADSNAINTHTNTNHTTYRYKKGFKFRHIAAAVVVGLVGITLGAADDKQKNQNCDHTHIHKHSCNICQIALSLSHTPQRVPISRKHIIIATSPNWVCVPWKRS